MSRFRVRLTIILIGLTGLSVLAAGLLTGHYYRENHQHALQEHMERELQVLIAAVPWPAPDDAASQRGQLQQAAMRFKELAGMRITYIRPDGVVVGDSERDSATMENHLDRNEVQEALRDGLGTGVRRSGTLGDRMLYVAMAVKKGDATVGVARLAMSLSDVERSLNRMWLALIGGLALLFALAAVVSYRIALGVTHPLERMTSAAKRMANMDYTIRVPEGGRDEIGELARALNAMSGSLQVQMNQIRHHGNRLQSVLDNMTSGVVMIARDGRVTLFNRQAEQLLGLSAQGRVGRSYAEWRQHYELAVFIRDGIERNETLHGELAVYYPEERLLAASIVPMSADEPFDPQEDGVPERSGHPGEAGMLLVLQDVTAIRRLERMRSEFVANVSHELKTPVAAVKGFAETLLGGAMNDAETARSFLTIIYDESDRLNRLIGDILELSKIESRRSPLQFEPIEATAFMLRMRELLSPDAMKKGIELIWETEDGLFLEADEDRLGQIVINLVQNGINYTPEGGKVKVKVESLPAEPESDRALSEESAAGGNPDEYGMTSERVRITVTDTGIGIPKKDLPRIFERFYRVDKARSRSSGGTGLGLSIVKHLVELHHGTIRVDSTVGVGSRFVLELPLIQP